MKKRAAEKLGGTGNDDAAEQIGYLHERVRMRDLKIVQQQKIINRLNRELNAEKQKNSRRKK